MSDEVLILFLFHSRIQSLGGISALPTITVDCGAMVNLIKEATAFALNAKIHKSVHSASQMDGKSPVIVVGETTIKFTRNGMTFTFCGLVCRNMEDDILAGIPFIEDNGIDLVGSEKLLRFPDGTEFYYSDKREVSSVNVGRIQSELVRSSGPSTTVFPGEFLELDLPQQFHDEKFPVAIEPRPNVKGDTEWILPALVRSVNGKIRVINNSKEPKKVLKGQHMCQVMHSTRPRSVSFVIE